MIYREYFPHADFEKIENIRSERMKWLERESVRSMKEALESVKDINTDFSDYDKDSVIIGRPEDINDEQKRRLLRALQTMIPWRKGPFNIFGVDVDSEWRSCRKWDRVLKELPNLDNKVIADIGCNNGYYMFRMLKHKPKFILGFDPTVRFYYTFNLLKSFKNINNIDFELLGVESIDLYKKSFDVVFLMGIIYHHPSPIDILRKVKSALRPGGTIILESQGIPGDEAVALFPEKRYAKVPGTYFVPTVKCLENFLQRSGFKNIKTFCTHQMSSKEQRRTEWMRYESYDNFIDPRNPELTIEGYPAPIRIYTKANV